MTKLPKNQHYVPQFLLRGFRDKKRKDQIHVFDKHNEASFRTAIRNVAAENGFYNYTVGTDLVSAEPFLGNMETDCSCIINRIRDDQSLVSLTLDDRVKLAFFTAIQILRVKQARWMLEELNKHIHDKIVAIGGNPSEIMGCGAMDEADIKQSSIDQLLSAQNHAPYILNKAWVILRAPKSHLLHISDNPVTLQNTIPKPRSGGLGIGVDGIEIYLPISSRLTLMFLCPKLAGQFLVGAENAEMLKRQFGVHVPMENVNPLADAIRTGQPMDLPRECVDNLNSLQVVNATRFVFSSNPEFEVAREMILKDPGLKDRPTFQVL